MTVKWINWINYHYQSLSITINHHQSLSITINHYQSLSITINHCQSLSITINHYQSLSITINHYQSLSITIIIIHQHQVDKFAPPALAGGLLFPGLWHGRGFDPGDDQLLRRPGALPWLVRGSYPKTASFQVSEL